MQLHLSLFILLHCNKSLKHADMKFLFSCTNHLTRYLGTDLPHLPTPDGEQAGVRRLVSTPVELKFQCHYSALSHEGRGPAFLLAIEAESRYCMILPLLGHITQQELCVQLQALYLQHAGYQLCTAQMLYDADLSGLQQLFDSMQPQAGWVKNTDRSLQGTLTQLEFFLQDALALAGESGLSALQIFNLSLQFNATGASRTVNGRKERFVPTPRFIADVMLRFGPLFLQQRLPNNVVDLAAYKAMRG